jgi:hypothetical protein
VPANLTLNFTNLNTVPVPTGDGKFYVAIANAQQHYDPASATQFAPNTGSVSSYPLPAQVTIPDGFSSGIIVIFAGKQLDLPGGAHPGVPGPTDGTVAATPYEFLEFTTNGANTAIDTSQVDQFGFPVTLTWNDKNQSVGVDLATNRTNELAAYTTFLNAQGPEGAPYNDLVMRSGGNVIRVESPAKFLAVNRGGSSALKTAFDTAIKSLFETPRSDADLTLVGAAVGGATAHYVGKPAQVNGLNVLRFTSPDNNSGNVGPLVVYEPLTPPSWVNASESGSEMVFACDGVFADAGLQQPGLNGNQITVLGDLEVQLSAALNRGVSSLPSPQWSNSSNFYPAGQPENLYAKFIHKGIDSSTNRFVFIDGKGYGFGFDETGGAPSKFEGVPLPATMTITLGIWSKQNLLQARNAGRRLQALVASLAQRADQAPLGSAALLADVLSLVALVKSDAPTTALLVNAALQDPTLPGPVRQDLGKVLSDVATLQTQTRTLPFALAPNWAIGRQAIYGKLKDILGLMRRLAVDLEE